MLSGETRPEGNFNARMELMSLFSVLRRHVFLIVALCIVTALAGYGVTFISALIPEKYESSATVLVRPHDPIKIEPNNSGKEFLDFPVGQTPVVELASKTYIQIIQSPTLIAEVVRELKLDQRPEAGPTGGIPWLHQIVLQVCDIKSQGRICDFEVW